MVLLRPKDFKIYLRLFSELLFSQIQIIYFLAIYVLSILSITGLIAFLLRWLYIFFKN